MDVEGERVEKYQPRKEDEEEHLPVYIHPDDGSLIEGRIGIAARAGDKMDPS